MSRASLTVASLFGDTPAPRDMSAPLAREFVVPPFSVLNAGADEWKKRKRQWLDIGIQSETGRSATAYDVHEWAASVDNVGARTDFAHGWKSGGVSVFDPVLCELVYNWFAPPGGHVLDPFAGGSVRGVVADACGLSYHGIELRPEQVAANKTNGATIGVHRVDWVCGDSAALAGDAVPADLLFTCPPYGDLETYSADPRDLSNMTWPAFKESFSAIVEASCDRLRTHRFAAFVVGNFRAPNGAFRNLVSLTVDACEAAGLSFYNEAVLVQPLGTMPVRVGKQFRATRKMGKVHQNLLVFVKGDARKAAAACTGGDT